MIWFLVKYILTAAFKDRIILSFLLLLVGSVSLSLFLGSASVTEKDQTSLVFTAAMLRFSSVVVIVIFSVFYIRKAFDMRDVEFILTRPISRSQFLAGHFVSLSILAACMVLLIFLTFLVIPGNENLMGILVWCGSLLIELLIVSSAAIFFSFVLSSAVTATLITFAFYTLSRMIGGIIGVINNEAESSMIFLEKVMLFISIFIPRLDLLGQGDWLLYGYESTVSWLFMLSQGIVFIGLIFFATLIDFKNKQF